MAADVLIILVLTGMMAFGALSISQDKMDPLFLFSLLYFPAFVIRPAMVLFELDTLEHAWLFRADTKELARMATLAFGIAYIAFAAGYSMRGPVVRKLSRILPGFHAERLDVKRLRIVVMGMICLSAIIVGYFIRSIGSAAEFMFEARHGLFAGVFILQKIPLLTGFLAAALMLHALVTKKGRGSAAALLFVALSITVLMGDRSAIIYPLLAILVGRSFATGQVNLARFGLGLVGLAALLVVMGSLRSALFTSDRESLMDSFESTPTYQTETNYIRDFADHANLSAVDHFLVVLQDFDSTNYRYGEDFYNGFLGVVPRSIWPEKPVINPGGWWRDKYMPGSGGKPFTAVGAWWVNFGFTGMAFGLFLSGLLYRSVWDYVRGSGFKPWAVIFYVATFVNVTSWGIITTAMPSAIIFWIVPLWAVYRFVLVNPKPAPKKRPQLRLASSRPTDRRQAMPLLKERTP